MNRFEHHCRRVLVFATRPVAFLLVLGFVGFFTISMPDHLSSLYWVFRGQDSFQISIYEVALLRFLSVITLAFYLAVGVRIVLITRKYLEEVWKQLIPPFPVYKAADDHLPVTNEATRYPTRKKRWLVVIGFIISLFSMLLMNYLFHRYLIWETDRYVAFIEQTPLDILVGVASYLTSVPLTSFGGAVSLTSPEEQVLALTVIWIPAIPLAVTILNLISYFYHSLRESLFYVALSPLKRISIRNPAYRRHLVGLGVAFFATMWLCYSVSANVVFL